MPSLPGVAPDPARLHVLVVEDEPLLRWALVESLAAAGHTVVAADDAAGALEAVTADPSRVDAILLDFRLPDSSDLGLLRRLRQRAPGSSVVLMTASNTPELTRDAVALGAFRVLDKPFDMQVVEACLRAAATQRGPHDRPGEEKSATPRESPQPATSVTQECASQTGKPRHAVPARELPSKTPEPVIRSMHSSRK